MLLTGVQDLAGNPLAAQYEWIFTTAAAVASGPVAAELGEAGRFIVLASAAVTTTVGSVLSGGDMGIMDIPRSNYAGFTIGAAPGQFDELTGGLSYAPDDMPPFVVPVPYDSTIAFINQVRTDVNNAYTFLAADPNPGMATQVCPIQLGELILTPGVYKSDVNVLLTTGALHLDGQGDANAVFIFSIAGDLTVGPPSGEIILEGSAQAKNVYFRTGGAMVINPGRTIFGNFFAWSRVEVQTGSSVTGRLFALTEQVTLDANTVTAPAL